MSDLVRYTADDDLLAKRLVDSKQWGEVRTIEVAAVRLLFGRDMGLSPTESMTLHIIGGKPVLPANLQAVAIKRSGKYDYRVRESTATRCVVEFFERVPSADQPAGIWDSIGVCEWRIDHEAKHLAEKDIWKNYPRPMLRNRAISEGYKTYCPDALGGTPVYVEGEIDEPRAIRSAHRETVEAAPVRVPASEGQIAAVRNLIEAATEYQPTIRADVEEYFGQTIEDLNADEAVAAIKVLTAKVAQMREGAAP